MANKRESFKNKFDTKFYYLCFYFNGVYFFSWYFHTKQEFAELSLAELSEMKENHHLVISTSPL